MMRNRVLKAENHNKTKGETHGCRIEMGDKKYMWMVVK